MSADNGLYILETNKGAGKEYRVAYHMAVENYEWDDDKIEMSNDPDIWIKNARDMWKDCKVFTDRDKALQEADRQYQNLMGDPDGMAFLEYGISFIVVPREF